MMRINKYIASCGLSSRRGAEKLINDGRISINGSILYDLSYNVKENDLVCLDNKPISIEDIKLYLILNKPVGYTSTNKDKYAKKTIFELIDLPQRLFSIGRLDKDSRGLIILTNDGDVYNKIMHPGRKISKNYIVEIDKDFDISHKNIFETGIDIGGYITKPCRLEIIDKRKLSVFIHEGKKRQIRLMFDKLGYKVLDLNRVSIGDISLGNLKIGQYRNLTNKELEYIKNLG